MRKLRLYGNKDGDKNRLAKHFHTEEQRNVTVKSRPLSLAHSIADGGGSATFWLTTDKKGCRRIVRNKTDCQSPLWFTCIARALLQFCEARLSNQFALVVGLLVSCGLFLSKSYVIPRLVGLYQNTYY